VSGQAAVDVSGHQMLAPEPAAQQVAVVSRHQAHARRFGGGIQISPEHVGGRAADGDLDDLVPSSASSLAQSSAVSSFGAYHAAMSFERAGPYACR